MDPERQEDLKRRFNFQAWRGRNVLRSAATLKAFDVSEGDVPGSYLRRRTRDSTVRPAVERTIWSRDESSNDELLSIETRVCESLQAAHEQLLELLGSFQSTALKEKPELNIGDVAFGISDPTMILFARANVVVLLRNAGPRVIGVEEVARRLDEKIVTQVSQRGSPQVP